MENKLKHFEALKPSHKAYLIEWFSNGFVGGKAYAVAYGHDYVSKNQICKNGSNELQRREDVKKAIKELFEDKKLNLDTALNRLEFLAMQNTDLNASINALKLYLKMEGHLQPKEIEVSIKQYKAKFG